jgi:hypothetical protein
VPVPFIHEWKTSHIAKGDVRLQCFRDWRRAIRAISIRSYPNLPPGKAILESPRANLFQNFT